MIQTPEPEQKMTTSELLLEDFDAEMANTRRLLERIPETPDYKPHDKSMPCGRLAMHVATLPGFGKTILTTPGMDMAKPTVPRADMTFTTRDNLLATFDSNAAEARKALAAASDDDLAAIWPFSFGEHVIYKNPALPPTASCSSTTSFTTAPS